MLPIIPIIAFWKAQALFTGIVLTALTCQKIDESIKESRENTERQEIIQQETTDKKQVFIVKSKNKIESAKSITAKSIVQLEKETKN